ncbi:tetratricopeptide repeat protein, partial [Planctomycetota bacterium]
GYGRFSSSTRKGVHASGINPRYRIENIRNLDLARILTDRIDIDQAAAKQARSLLNELELQEPGNFQVLLWQARLRTRTRDFEGARLSYGRILKMDSSDIDALTGLGRTYVLEGNFQKAREYFSKACKIDPRNYNVHVELADSYYQQGRFEDALDGLKKAIALNSDNPLSHDMKTKCLMAMGRWDRALDACRIMQKRFPDYALLYLNYATVLVKKEKMQEACNILLQGLKLARCQDQFYSHLAHVYLELKKYSLALTYAEHFLKLHPNSNIMADLRKEIIRRKEEY